MAYGSDHDDLLAKLYRHQHNNWAPNGNSNGNSFVQQKFNPVLPYVHNVHIINPNADQKERTKYKDKQGPAR